MIVPDVNLLLHAYNAGSIRHAAAKQWWEECLNGDESIGLAWGVVLGFVRISTNPRLNKAPLTIDNTSRIIRSWLSRPNVQLLHPGEPHEELLFRHLAELGTAGNLTTDAHLAALAVEYQAVLHTADTDFVRFSGLRWKNPLT